MARLLLEKPYRDRVRQARLRLSVLQDERPWLTKTWIGAQIRRNRSYVTQVLHEQAYGPPTLDLIEDLLDRVEAGAATAPASTEAGSRTSLNRPLNLRLP